MKKLSLKIKLPYGIGRASIGIKDGLFQLFLFFYFSQVLGLAPELAGLSSLVALASDAISDPLVGLISDKWQSKKWGVGILCFVCIFYYFLPHYKSSVSGDSSGVGQKRVT